MFTYFFINLTLIGFRPIKSSKTKICPSQLFEAPIPMVGILICFVIAFASELSMHSNTIEKTPAVSSNFASFNIFSLS